MTDTKKDTGKTGDKQPSPVPATMEKTLADSVLKKVQIFIANKDLRLPDNYSPENAIKSAWLILLETKDKNQKPVLEVCTKDSIANTLLNMVLQGLNPVKKQCDFIAYGDKLTLQREYHGTIALAKRYSDVNEPVGTIIYEGDEFEYTIGANGYKKVTKHVQKFESIDNNKIMGAYATLNFTDPKKEPYIEIMTMAQIRQSWNQGATKGQSPAHKNFPDEMCKKTVISRACKLFISSSDDSALFDEDDRDERSAASHQAIAENANKEELTMDASYEIVEEKKKPERKPVIKLEQQPMPVEVNEASNFSDLGKQTSKAEF